MAEVAEGHACQKSIHVWPTPVLACFHDVSCSLLVHPHFSLHTLNDTASTPTHARRRLAQQCWDADPSLRPRAGDLVVAIKTLLVQNAALRAQLQAQQQQAQHRQQG